MYTTKVVYDCGYYFVDMNTGEFVHVDPYTGKRTVIYGYESEQEIYDPENK